MSLPGEKKMKTAIKSLVLINVLLIIMAAFVHGDRIEIVRYRLEEMGWGGMYLGFGAFFIIINISVLIWRCILFLRYRPAPPCHATRLPFCTVVVPAYNEGRQVLMTLESLVQSNYPEEKLQIIAVDDGSADDTWHWICQAENAYPGRITTIRLPFNQGKRHALFAGFNQSKGDILVTVDSDSVVEPETLQRLVSPFVYDRLVGAVAGNVRVLNRSEGIIPRMLDVIYLFSFDFIRAAQSMVNTVLCTPGALSAYRTEVVMRILPKWINQRFCGRPANIGEDRAMTNLILREGYSTLFQQNALVYTSAPVRYKNLCRMFLRWARSNVRETLVMSTFAFRTFREGPMLGARINLFLQWMTLTTSQLLLLGTLASLFLYPTLIGIQVLLGIVISSSLRAWLYCWRERNTEGIWAYLYGIFWFLALSWITPYAIFTPYKTGWLTRQTRDLKPKIPRMDTGLLPVS